MPTESQMLRGSRKLNITIERQASQTSEIGLDEANHTGIARQNMGLVEPDLLVCYTHVMDFI